MSNIESSVESYAPVEADARIRGLDALRGVALLGIVWANVRQIFLPWDVASFEVPPGAGNWAWLDWQVFDAFIDLKFLTLFSLLFGVGFALQGERLTTRGHEFKGIYLRRVFILVLFGILHGTVLYPAEVLTPYAIGGLLLLAMQRFSTNNLFRIGFVLVGTTAIWAYQIGSLGMISIPITVFTIIFLSFALAFSWQKNWRIAIGIAAGIVLVAGILLTIRFKLTMEGESVASEYKDAQKQFAAMQTNNSKSWPEEFRARREGNFLALMKMHAGQYALVLFYFSILLLWRTLGLFLIGAGLFRSGVIANHSPPLWKKVAVTGLSIGLPLSLLATWLQGREIMGITDWRFPEFLHTVSALPLACGIAGAVFLLHIKPVLHVIFAPIEACGRMALTNYIGQSLILASIAEPWGFNLYGQLNGPAMTGLAWLVFILLALFSQIWLSRFRMGPLEWLWRCGTYKKWLPIR